MIRTRLGLLALAYNLGELKAHAEEQGDNWGPSVSVYLHDAGVDSPAPWCAALQCWSTDQACALAKTTNPLAGVKNRAYVQSYVDYAIANKLTIPAGLARPGDLVAYAFDKNNPTHFDHIGMLMTRVVQDNFHAVEGNTNDDGSREGYKVADKSRIYRIDRTTFIGWDKFRPAVEGDFEDVLSVLDEYHIQA